MTSRHQTTPNRPATRSLVYVTRRIPQVGVSTLLKTCDVRQWDSENAVPRGEFLYSVFGVDGLFCMPGDKIDSELLDSAGPQLKAVATMSHSIEHIDAEECYRRDIQVITCPYEPTEILAEQTIALVLQTMKESLSFTADKERGQNVLQPLDIIPNTDNDLINTVVAKTRNHFLKHHSDQQLTFQCAKYRPENIDCLIQRNMIKKTFGIFGLPNLGLGIAKMLNSFGVREILITDPMFNRAKTNTSLVDCKFVSFDELIEKSDVICVCGHNGKYANEFFTVEVFQKMKKDAILIASRSRNRAINYLDLYEALRSGQVKDAGINDCNQEPVPFKSLLQGLKNCTFLPQTQESVHDARHTVAIRVAKALTEALSKLTIKNA